MVGYQTDVFLQTFYIFENVVIDALKEIPFAIRILAFDNKRVVDKADFQWSNFTRLGFELELFCYLFHILRFLKFEATKILFFSEKTNSLKRLSS